MVDQARSMHIQEKNGHIMVKISFIIPWPLLALVVHLFGPINWFVRGKRIQPHRMNYPFYYTFQLVDLFIHYHLHGSSMLVFPINQVSKLCAD